MLYLKIIMNIEMNKRVMKKLVIIQNYGKGVIYINNYNN